MWFSLLGGSVAGLICVRAALWSVFTRQPMDWSGWYAGHVIGGYIGNLLIPALMALLARRRYFLWASLAVGVKLSWVLAELVLTRNRPGVQTLLVEEGRGDLFDLFLLAGLISFIRFLVVRKRDQTAAAQEAINPMPAAQYPPHQEDIWPPPPTKPTDT